jgi:hypothetical protein
MAVAIQVILKQQNEIVYTRRLYVKQFCYKIHKLPLMLLTIPKINITHKLPELVNPNYRFPTTRIPRSAKFDFKQLVITYPNRQHFKEIDNKIF